MWLELPAETIGVHALQYRGDAPLVSDNLPDDFVAPGRLQRHGGIAVAAATGRRRPLGTIQCANQGMDVVRPQSGTVWLGADCGRTPGLGLSGVEGSSTQGSRMVHAKVAYAVAGGRLGPGFAVVDSGGRAPGAVPVDDRKIPGAAGVAGGGCSPSRAGVALRGRGVARLSARAWESAERGKHVLVDPSAHDDHAGLGRHFIERLTPTNGPKPFLLSAYSEHCMRFPLHE